MELVFNPRNNVEQYVSKALRFIHPYLAFVTYRFHVEKAREIGKNHCLKGVRIDPPEDLIRSSPPEGLSEDSALVHRSPIIYFNII